MVRTPKKDGEVEPRRMNHDSSTAIYITESVKDE